MGAAAHFSSEPGIPLPGGTKDRGARAGDDAIHRQRAGDVSGGSWAPVAVGGASLGLRVVSALSSGYFSSAIKLIRVVFLGSWFAVKSMLKICTLFVLKLFCLVAPSQPEKLSCMYWYESGLKRGGVFVNSVLGFVREELSGLACLKGPTEFVCPEMDWHTAQTARRLVPSTSRD